MAPPHPVQAAEAAAAPKATGVDVLSDEVLVMIFSKITDAWTLFRVLPLVCKRWCRLARDASSWASAVLDVSLFVEAEATMLLHAPALASLVINAKHTSEFDNPQGCYNAEACDRLRAALRRTRAVVHQSVRVTRNGWRLLDDDDQADSLACFLRRQPALLEADLFLGSEDAEPTVAAIATLRSLRKLALTTSEQVCYRGELSGALPQLREVRVHGECPRDYSFYADMDVPCGLVGDLVRGAPALRVLEVDMPRAADRAACAALRALEHVKLNVYRDCRRRQPIGEAALRGVRQAGELLLKMAGPALRSAVITLCSGEESNYSYWRRELCEKAVAEAAAKMPADVKVELDMGEECGCHICGSRCPRRDWPGSDDDSGEECNCEECS